MRFRNCLLILFLFTFMVSCSKMIIMKDGIPLSNYTFYASNPGTGIQLDITAAQWKYVKEGNEKKLWPEYIRMNKRAYVGMDEESVRITVRIRNPKKAFYKVYQVYDEKDLYKEKGYMMELYKGRLMYRTFEIKYPIYKEVLSRTRIKIVDENEQDIMCIGDIIYKVTEYNKNEGGGM